MFALQHLITRISQPASPPATHTIVVRRGLSPAYYRFMQITANANQMALIIDQRVSERRHVAGTGVERRSGDRRRPDPPTWGSEGWLLLSKGRGPVVTHRG